MSAHTCAPSYQPHDGDTDCTQVYDLTADEALVAEILDFHPRGGRARLSVCQRRRISQLLEWHGAAAHTPRRQETGP